MNPIKYKVFEKIAERDGLLMKQLYEFLPKENRISYSTLRRWIAQEAAINKVSRTKFEQLSNCVYLTNSRKLSTKRKRLMVLVAQWEVHTGKKAIWYKPSTELHLIYLMMAKHLKPSGDTIADIEEAKFRKRYLIQSHDWMKKTMEDKVRRAEHQRLRRLGLEKKNNIRDDSNISKAFDINKFEYYKKPNPSLYGLWSRGIMPYFFHSKIDKSIESIAWIFLDIEKDLPVERFLEGVRAIFDFMIIHELKEIPFKIAVYTWNQKTKELYQKRHQVSLKRIALKEKYPRQREKLWVSGQYRGTIFINFNIDKYLNPIRIPGINPCNTETV